MQPPVRPEPPARSTGSGTDGPVRALRIIARSLARRCPNCGSSGVFRTWLHQRSACPACRLLLDRGERDFFIGAYTINLIVAELLVVAGALAIALIRWPDVPWTGLTWGLAVLMVVAPVALYPVSRQLWLACDLIFQPAEAGDFVGGPEGHAPGRGVPGGSV